MGKLKPLMRIWGGVVMALFVACQFAQHEQLLTRAEVYVETHPDSTLYYLAQLKDTLALSEEHRARYALLLVQASHKALRSLPDDSVIEVAVEYYTWHDDPKRLARAWLYKGLVHKSKGDIVRATEAFAQSERCYEQVEDWQYKGLLYSHYGSLLQQQQLYKEALACYKKKYECELHGDSLHYVVSACQGVALMYRVLNQPDSAEWYYRRAFAYKDKVNPKTRVQLLHSYGSFLTQCGKYDEAEKLLLTGIEQFTTLPEKCRQYVNLADFYRQMERYEESREYALKIIDSPDSSVVETGYLLLAKACQALGDEEGALRYDRLYKQYGSDLKMRLQTTEVAQIPHEVKYRWLLQEKKESEMKNGLLAVGLLVVTGSTLAVGRWYKQRHRKEMEAKSEKLQEMTTELAATKDELEQKRLDCQKQNADAAMWKAANQKRKERIERMEMEANGLQQERTRLEREIKRMQTESEAADKREARLKRKVEEAKRETEKEQKRREKTESRLAVLELLRAYLVDGNNLKTVSLVMECLSQQKNRHLLVSPNEYAKTLQPLADYKHPGISTRIQALTSDERELAVCYLLYAGIDDAEALAYATNLSVKSLYQLRKRCLDLLDSLH